MARTVGAPGGAVGTIAPVSTVPGPTVLERIIAAHRKAAEADKRWLDATM
ncbi:MAG: hypothetical protein QOI56_941, partial [Actinomycetota bacterium]|nr:hypothetical protein [Actinomycetota bacterium]